MASSFSSPWPNLKSVVLSKITFDVPLSVLFEWLSIRDVLVGDNGERQNISKALALAKHCKHPDAVWLTSIFENDPVTKEEEKEEKKEEEEEETKEETKEGVRRREEEGRRRREEKRREQARNVFLAHEDDARAVCFAWWMLSDDEAVADLSMLRHAADMGYAFALSTLASHEDSRRLALAAVSKGERDGFFQLGHLLCHEDKNLALGKENLLIAAELGELNAVGEYGLSFGEFDPERWLWLGRAALRGYFTNFLELFPKQILERSSPVKLFLIGRALKGNVDVENQRIFGVKFDFIIVTDVSQRAVNFYMCQVESARLAVDAWVVIGKRLGVVKDIRRVIASLIWDARFEANYKCNNSKLCSQRKEFSGISCQW